MRIWNATKQLLYDIRREQELMDILEIESMDQVTIIPWRSPNTPPQNDCYVLLKFYDPDTDEIAFDYFAYENGVYSYTVGDETWFDLPQNQILGWAYPICTRKNEKPPGG